MSHGQCGSYPLGRETGFLDKWMLDVISRGEATFSLDANRHVMNQRRRFAITNSLPVTENWTRVAQMAHFVANRCHTPYSSVRRFVPRGAFKVLSA
jgi:hypothetical protein